MAKKYTHGHQLNLEEVNLIVSLIAKTGNPGNLKRFFEIIFTRNELEEVIRRLQAILLFYQNKSIREVKKELNMGINTVSRLHIAWQLNKKFFDNIFDIEKIEKRQEKIKEYTLLSPEMRYFLKRLLKGK